MDQIVEFQDNIPQQVALLYLQGKPIETARGPRVMFSLKGGKKLFVDPPVAKMIADLGAGKGEPISICKRDGGFEVKRVESGEPSAKVTSRPPDGFPQNGPSASDHTRTGWSSLKVALFSVIEDAVAAEEYANGKGLSIRFSAEDIRTMANTKVINDAAQFGGR